MCLVVATPADAQWPMPAVGVPVSPPTTIEGLDAHPTPPLEFSRAWLARAAEVRNRRAELAATGELDGMDPATAAEHGAALTGTLRVPVIPIRYSDVPVPFDESILEERLFGESRGDTLSYADYWNEVSGGLLSVTGEVAPWVTLRRSARFYLPPEDYGWGRFGRMSEVWDEVARAAAERLDLGAFDNDGPDGEPNSGDDDGYVDFLVIVYAVDCRGDWRAGSIWPHRGAMRPVETDQPSASGGNIKLADYVILPAVDPTTCAPLQIGVLAHETGHALGLPDLYDYDGSSQGIGAWGLMGMGSQSLPHSPAHLSAWSKEQLGWVQVDWLKEDTMGLEFPPVTTHRRVFRHDLAEGRGEYLLIENRQPLGSDRALPGHGLLVWKVDPEQAEIGEWNGDEHWPAVSLIQADGRDELGRGAPADATDPFPGAAGIETLATGFARPFYLTRIRETEGSIVADVRIGHPQPALIAATPVVRFSATPSHDVSEQRVAIRPEGGASSDWFVASETAEWLDAARDGDTLVLNVKPRDLVVGLYEDTVKLAADEGDATGAVVVQLDVVPAGRPQIVATRLPWSWGLAATSTGIIKASYAWDPLRMEPRPRLLELRPGSTLHSRTLARLPADALYAPVPTAYGDVHVLARADGQNYLYRVGADGSARIVAQRFGDAPAYGMTRLPDHTVLVADWSGELHRVDHEGRVQHWGDLGTHVYQIDAAEDGTLYAAMHDGDVMRIDPTGTRSTVLRTGFGAGELVTVAAGEDGAVYAAERGGGGRILRFDAAGRREVIAQVPGAEFYGLAVHDGFVYALDLRNRNLLRVGLP